jgi:hypothetical protein
MNTGRAARTDLLERYSSFWLLDHRKRATALSCVIFTVATLGFVLNCALDVSLDSSIKTVTVVGILLLLVIPAGGVELPIRFWERFAVRVRYRVAAFVCSVAVLFLGNIPASVLQAAIVDKCMEEAGRGKISPQRLARSFNAASESHVRRINRTQLQAVTTKIVYQPGLRPDTMAPPLVSRDRWDLLISAVNLASSLEPMPPLPSVSAGFGWDFWRGLPKDDPAEPMFVLHGRTERREEQAHYQRLGVPKNMGSLVGPEYIEARGGAIDLDDSDIARVVFNGVRVEYHGTRTSLREVRFVNCTFRIAEVWALSPHQLVEKLLAGGSVSFPD